MIRVAAGDRQAFTELVGRHVPCALSIARRITGNRSEAEDVVQEAFLRVWVKASDWRPRRSPGGGALFTTWFRRVLVNLCIDRLRRPTNLPLDAATEVADGALPADAALTRSETERRVADAVARLPVRQRAALTLCHFEGLSNIEAAEALSLTVGAVESLLVRARQNLRDLLADLAPEPVENRGESR